MTNALHREYRRQRQHQASVEPSATTEPSGRVEYTYASAPYGEHALSAFLAAKQSLYFRKWLRKTVATDKKRSRAAKRGWQKRRAA